MRIQTFQAADMRDAIVQVKRALGPDAVIVATRDVRRGILGTGVEVTAAIDAGEELAPAPQPTHAPSAGLAEADVERIMLPIRSELRTLRALLKPTLGQRSTEIGDLRAEIEALRKDIAGRNAPPRLDDSLRATLCAPSTARVVAMVGPTGVGKTTTIAKLAARAALVERRQVAIVTLDSYRVGGEEQMRAFADLMGVPLHIVGAPADLAEKLAALRGMDRICVDTAGRRPRDAAGIGQVEQALAVTSGIEVHLVMPAGLPLVTVESIHRCYRRLAPARLLFTKLDEADDLSSIVHGPAR